MTPCSGKSIATIANPACANASAIANITVRFSVMPCWKITTGQPPAGCVSPVVEFGSVPSSGMRFAATRGTGVAFAPVGGCNCEFTQKLVSGLAGSP